MSSPEFRWSSPKAAANAGKHRVSFLEAVTVFADDRALLIEDPDHSFHEQRFILLGQSATMRLLVVVHCHRESDDSIRIISARRATRSERGIYARGREG